MRLMRGFAGLVALGGFVSGVAAVGTSEVMRTYWNSIGTQRPFVDRILIMF
jgi:hypothetical protein